MSKIHFPGLMTVFVAVIILFFSAQADSHEKPTRYREAAPTYDQNDFYYQNRIAPPPDRYIYYRQRSNNMRCRHCAPRPRHQHSGGPQQTDQGFYRPPANNIPSVNRHAHGDGNFHRNYRVDEQPNRINYPPPLLQRSGHSHSHQHLDKQTAPRLKRQSPASEELPQMEIPSIEPLTP